MSLWRFSFKPHEGYGINLATVCYKKAPPKRGRINLAAHLASDYLHDAMASLKYSAHDNFGVERGQ